ncbi:DUF11 domain-containing protein [Massiliimalia massiliensis]|uniref:DUF11 domain-containing protein n=1 Tax=Massiliimalia massiliensis TaxID=1852384 RepID=UPI000984F370|nr:DUF11 domain-containing protein [Massiliimalia massiliensis]
MDKIPFCFPVFYHGLIARRTVYSQPEVVNLLLSGNMRAEPVKWPDVDRMTANKYINGLECFSSYRRKEIFELPDKDLLARIQKLKIQNIKTTVSAFHEFLKNRTQASEETIYSLESSVRESEDPCQYYVVALREALSFTRVSKEYITTQLKNELHNLHKNSDVPDLFQLQKEAHKQGITSISMTPDKTFLSKIIGRDEIVQSICDKLKKERKHIQLRGMGGIGKSEILRKVYSWFLENPGEHFYAHIAYLYYSGKFKSDLDSAIDYPGKETSANPIEYLKHLANTSKVLLFIDDVRNQKPDKSEIYEEDASFEEIVGSNISILFASRIMRMDFLLISVKPLPIESCIDIFLREYNANIDDDVMTAVDTECCVAEALTAEDKERLVQIIDGRAGRNTLVINRLGALARDYGWTITQLEKELIDRNFNIRQGLSENNAEYIDEQTLQDELNKLYDYNEIKDAAERSILEGFTLLADVPTDIATCAKWFSRDAEIDEDRCRIALMRLMRRSWLLSAKSKQNEAIIDNYSMHNIVRAAIKAQVEVDREEHQDLVMKVWTNLTMEVRKKDESEPKWADKVYAVPGECVRFRIGIRNMSSEMFRNLTLRNILPTGLSYINGSTQIYNAKHPQGVTLSDNIITDMGVNIGDYAPGANAWIYFDATASEIPSSKNVIYRNIIQACGGYGAKEQSADVIMDTYEAL